MRTHFREPSATPRQIYPSAIPNETYKKATISIKKDVVMAVVQDRLTKISNIRFYPDLQHGQVVEGIIFRYDEINGERSFNKHGKYIRFKITATP